jgi:purine-binding chemotaxis protein CheW
MPKTKQFCTFFLDDQFFGIPVEHVQEVIQHQEMTPVPLVPAAVRGLINLRGQIVLAVDLRRRLGMEDMSGTRPPMNVVVRTDEGALSLLVDEIGDVLEVSEDGFEPVPGNVPDENRNLLLGVYKIDQKLLHVLDTGKACQV